MIKLTKFNIFLLLILILYLKIFIKKSGEFTDRVDYFHVEGRKSEYYHPFFEQKEYMGEKRKGFCRTFSDLGLLFLKSVFL